ncbi:MAG: hypothetical protein KUF77_11680 [Candidatus Thiodiazotropha sp. (ex Lucina aurantia)]|nr:hypothetical protein [Candidatus Thiodiazotropha taylori]MBV2098749.1 hypothetical protein [Candidatus Thiodiazotropha sp. (ex Codakia orbicularis)]MBV2103675.1 hypothetical protein [Candidatus Thiodiazotropha sp. (ex Lucina aurantia)]MBV2118114.1 hypothetical protein [Candidatus Thiodiazotropha sp. (ex Lucina aurantia)]
MKKSKSLKQQIIPPNDAELQKVARRIAVERGLVLPETEEEVIIHDQSLVSVLAQKSGHPPRALQEVLDQAAAIESHGGITFTQSDVIEPDVPFAMAARNGEGENISEESHQFMQEVMQKDDEDD